MTLKPMNDIVLLKQKDASETTVGGIILATATKEKPAIYQVVAVGPTPRTPKCWSRPATRWSSADTPAPM